MFKRRQRLPRAAFEEFLSTGRRRSGPNLAVVISDRIPGYAVVVPKRVERLSVGRHRIKRRVLAALAEVSLPRGVIVFPRAAVARMPYDEVRAELARLLA